jgi:hypothetical protein
MGRPRRDHVLEIKPEILQAIEEEPNLSIRRLALRVCVSTFIVYRTFNEQGFTYIFTMSNVFKLFNMGIHFGGLLFVNDVAGRSTRYQIF